MIQSASLFTYELDDPTVALAEIQSQLSEKLALKEHTVGILMCDPEFIETGVYRHLCENLPFPVAGATTMSQAVNGEGGILMLTLFVMTSDDVFFEAGMTAPIEAGGGNIPEAMGAAYVKAAAGLPEAPRLAIVFPPLFVENAGDQYVEVFETLCPNMPVFGTIAIDDTTTFDTCFTMCGGEVSRDRLSFILLAGAVSPRFLVTALSDDNALPYAGEITRSEGHIVHEINGQSAYDYFAGLGMAKDGRLDEGLQFVPFLLDFKKRFDYDGVPVVRAMVCFDERGAGICRGYMYENAVFTLTNPTPENIMSDSADLVEKINALPDRQAVILFSCMVRRMTFGTEPMREIDMLLEKMDPAVPFMMAYAGGEICPTSAGENAVTNRFHNYSMIACIL
ncbi:FIST C-terminal domain-containing protein [Synergistaceae bacterium OttesenSCG-928-I11]|nr:FIST C-terminal domain-containing protein [Synergistaceae bacterium OttesenSCG-928-I11]